MESAHLILWKKLYIYAMYITWNISYIKNIVLKIRPKKPLAIPGNNQPTVITSRVFWTSHIRNYERLYCSQRSSWDVLGHQPIPRKRWSVRVYDWIETQMSSQHRWNTPWSTLFLRSLEAYGVRPFDWCGGYLVRFRKPVLCHRSWTIWTYSWIPQRAYEVSAVDVQHASAGGVDASCFREYSCWSLWTLRSIRRGSTNSEHYSVYSNLNIL